MPVVIISPPYLMAQANLLQLLRQSQGMPTIAVNIEDVYDEFNYGNKSPYALKSLVKIPERGAIAVWASTALTYPTTQTELHKEFFQQVFSNREARLGDAVIRAKAIVSDMDVRRTWMLFADPTLRLR